MVSAGDTARYRAGTASLLATSVEAAGEIERWLDSGADGGEGGSQVQAWLSQNPEDSSWALAAPADDPTGFHRIICALLLRKARIHALAVLRANETNNAHSLAVQMRPVLECAGQVAFIFHHLFIAPDLLMEPERAASTVTGYMDADYYRTVIGATKGGIGHEELLQTISEAAEAAAAKFGMPRPEARKGKRLRHGDKVAMLSGGNVWYDRLSEYFCHGEADWTGPSWQGGVTAMDATHDLTCAGMMHYLADQVAFMNAYASLCPVAGRVDHDRVDAALAQLREVREASAALLNAAGLAVERHEASEG